MYVQLHSRLGLWLNGHFQNPVKDELISVGKYKWSLSSKQYRAYLPNSIEPI